MKLPTSFLPTPVGGGLVYNLPITSIHFNAQRPTSNAQQSKEMLPNLGVGRWVLGVRFDFSPVTHSFSPGSTGGRLAYNFRDLQITKILRFSDDSGGNDAFGGILGNR